MARAPPETTLCAPDANSGAAPPQHNGITPMHCEFM